MPKLTSTIVAMLVAVLSACGGSGGGGGVTTTPPRGPVALGSRGVPGGTVTVSSAGAITPGAANTFHLALGDGLAPTRVAAWIGNGIQADEAGIAAVPTAAGTGAYDVSLAVPETIPVDGHVRVRLEFADGSVIETGADDFPLLRP